MVSEHEDTITLRIIDEETGEELEREEVPRSVIEKINRMADVRGTSFDDALNMVFDRIISCIERVESMEDDPLFKRKAVKMLFEVLSEMQSPSWKPPEGMVIEGNAPPEAIALCIVKMRLHMSEHNN